MMRKLLPLMVLLPAIAFGQIPESGGNQAVVVTLGSESTSETISESPVVINSGPVTTTYSSQREYLFDIVEIGETTYDLQVNSALARRVILYPDGKVSATYTYAKDGTPFFTRGTAYAHYDGSSWGEAPTDRIEDQRAGWSNLGTVTVNGTVREFVVSHYASPVAEDPSGGLFILMNDEVGSTNWQVVEEYQVANGGPSWPRAVGMGSTIHIFTAANPDRYQKVNEVVRPNSYYRYDAANDQWLDEQVLLPGYDTSRVVNGRSDAYIMDATESAIAIVSGGSGQDLFLWKSTDNGESWTSTIVDSFPIPAWAGNDDFLDTFETNSGSVGLILDDNDVAHVFYNRNRVTEDDALADSAWSFFPGTNGIVYWNETEPDSHFVIAGMLDLDGLEGLQIPDGQTTLENGSRYINNTLACYPSAGIDADGTIYMIYSAPTETQVAGDGRLFRDVYVVYSEDGGDTWSDAQTLVDNYSEDVFASIARDVDDNVHVVWQRDDITGTQVQNGHSETLNKILYAAVPTSLIKNDQLTPLRSGVENPENQNLTKVVPYPNPADNQVQFNVQLERASNVQMQLRNSVGQLVWERNQNAARGSNKMQMDVSQLQAGIYVYQIQAGTETLTGQLIIE